MDSLDLLAREDEFKKLNKQLEKKTESLMKQIENAMQKQDIFSEFSHSLALSAHTHRSQVKHHCDSRSNSSNNSTPVKTKSVKKCVKEPLKKKNNEIRDTGLRDREDVELNVENSYVTRYVCAGCATESRRERIGDDLEFLYAFVAVSVQDRVLPASFAKDRATVESVCKFLSSKVKLLQEQIDILQSTINKKASQCEVHLTHQAELEGERMTLINRTKNSEASASDMKAKYLALQKKLDEKDRLYKEQRSETDKLSSEVKRLKSKNCSLEAKCASLEDSLDTVKQQLEAVKKSEKEFRDSTRTMSSTHEAAICQLESRIKSLSTRSARQDRLVHNLRQQRALLMADGAVKVLEEEYRAFLMKDI